MRLKGAIIPSGRYAARFFQRILVVTRVQISDLTNFPTLKTLGISQF
jgi:hypothetical protein